MVEITKCEIYFTSGQAHQQNFLIHLCVHVNMLKGIILRAKAKWIEEGEKPTKYFCMLEKRNYINKTITEIFDENGNTITLQEEILNEIKNFYKKLYANKDNELVELDMELLIKFKVPKLNDQQVIRMEGPITNLEVLKALKCMKNDKSPGTDGFTAEFFKFFWIDLGSFLTRSFNYSYEKRELSTTQKQGIISILPKGDKPRMLLKNWRPITLLNCSYKI